MKKWARYIKKLLPVLTILVLLVSSLNPFINAFAQETVSSGDEVAKLTSDLNKKRDEVNSGGIFKEIKKNELQKIAKDRKAKLVEAIKTDPREIIGNAVNPEDFPEDVRGDLEKKVNQRGVVSMVHKDSTNDHDRYFLLKNKNDFRGALEIVLDDPQAQPKAVGTELVVNGYILGDYIVGSSADNTSLLAAMPTPAVSPTGQKKVAIYYVNFLDDTSRTESDFSLKNYYNSTLNTFLIRSSHSRISTIAPNVYRVNLYINKKCDLGLLMNETTNMAGDQFGVNPADFDVNAIIFDNGCSGAAPGVAMLGTSWYYSVGTEPIPHEFGHLIGLAHAYGYYCGDSSVRDNCEWIEYLDPTDIMGTESGVLGVINAPDYSAFAKDFLGWYSGEEVIYVTQSGDYLVNKFEDPNSGGKVLKIRTYEGGPYYYIFYKKEAYNGFGPIISLASSSVCCGYKKTLLVDTTPGSEYDDLHYTDFDDAYLHNGQTYQDPFNGINISFKSQGASSVTLHVDVGQLTDGNGNIKINWTRPTAYLEAVGQQKTVDVSPIHYLVDLKCTYGAYCDVENFNQWHDPDCSGWPVGKCPPYDVTTDNVDLLLSRGFSYQYRVWILTKDDNNPNTYAPYLWQDTTDITNDCSTVTCTKNVTWPKATYKVKLYRDDNNNLACTGNTLGCSDSQYSYDTTSFTFKGIPKNVGYHANIKTTGFDGRDHLLGDIYNLGSSDADTHSCTTGDMTCKIADLTFNGNQPVTYSLKLRDLNGALIQDPDETYANPSGGFNRSWQWNYALAAYPDTPNNNCFVAGSNCKVGYVSQSYLGNFNYQFQGLVPFTNYKYFVCAKTCNAPNNSSVVKSGSVQSDGFNVTQFFANDPFAGSMPNKYTGEYFDNADFTNLKFTRFDLPIKFNWKKDSPDSAIASTTYSVRWTGSFDMVNAVYRFMYSSQEGAKVYVDGVKKLDTSSKNPEAVALQMTAGKHTIVVETVHSGLPGSSSYSSINFAFVKAYSCYDLNADGVVNVGDQSIMANHMGTKGISAWDINGDLVVNVGDQARLSRAVLDKVKCSV